MLRNRLWHALNRQSLEGILSSDMLHLGETNCVCCVGKNGSSQGHVSDFYSFLASLLPSAFSTHSPTISHGHYHFRQRRFRFDIRGTLHLVHIAIGFNLNFSSGLFSCFTPISTYQCFLVIDGWSKTQTH